MATDEDFRGFSLSTEGSSDEHREDAIVPWAVTRRLPLGEQAVLVRHVVTRDHLIPDLPSGSEGTRYRRGQVLVSRAQVALAVVDAPCQRPGETTTCASYVETTWVGR
jgi:hypothetical protein